MDTTIPGNPTDALSPSADVRCRYWSFQLHIGCKHIGFILSYISSYQNYTQTQTDIDHITLSVMSSTSRQIFFIIVSLSLMRDSITDIIEAIRVAHSLPQIPVDSSMIWLVYPSETSSGKCLLLVPTHVCPFWYNTDWKSITMIVVVMQVQAAVITATSLLMFEVAAVLSFPYDQIGTLRKPMSLMHMWWL